MGRAETIILGWLTLSCLRTDTVVTSAQLSSKEPVWPHENELLPPLGNRKGYMKPSLMQVEHYLKTAQKQETGEPV